LFNALKLLLIILVGLAYFTGLGWMLVGPVLHRSLITRKYAAPILREAPLWMAAGIVLNYAINLLVLSLRAGFIIGGLLAAAGLVCLVISHRRTPPDLRLTRATPEQWISFTVICLVYLAPILAEPLFDWDARSIWFFHAKMMYLAGSLGPDAGWNHYSVQFSHVDYPNLIPLIGAQVGLIAGNWNEYIPKISLVFAFVPAAAWLSSLLRKSLSSAVLLLVFPFCLLQYIWDGYMDGFLVFYFSLALLMLASYRESQHRVDLVGCLFSLAMLPYLKNEGALALLAGLAAVLASTALQRGRLTLRSIPRPNRWTIVAAVALISPLVLWKTHNALWHLANDLEIGSTSSVTRILSRLGDGSVGFILQNIQPQLQPVLLLLGFIVVAGFLLPGTRWTDALPAVLAGVIYFLGIFTIYLLTPHDLVWHLGSSIDRTMLSVSGCLYAACWCLLRSIEAPSDAPSPQLDASANPLS
jgi:hypothetical protein